MIAYKQLPAGYRLDYRVDAKDKKTAVLLNAVSVILFLAIFALLLLPALLNDFGSIRAFLINPLLYLGMAVCMVLYIILHELVHGAVYKMMTHEKLTFGLTLTVAYCGVPRLYVDRRTSLYAVTAPLIVFTILFAIACALSYGSPVYPPASLLFALHLSGCSGDIYVAWLLLFRYRNRPVLMNDTGPRQTFYIPEE